MTEECVIRKARMNDLRSVYLIEVKSFPNPYPPEYFITFLTLYPKYFYVAVCEDKVVGYVTGVINKDGSGHILSLAVLPSFRRKHIGQKLMETIEKAFMVDGISKIVLEVSQWNKIALNLYRRLGYKIAGIMPHYYPDGSDAYLMFKELRD